MFNYAFELLSFSGMGVQFVRSNCSDLNVVIILSFCTCDGNGVMNNMNIQMSNLFSTDIFIYMSAIKNF